MPTQSARPSTKTEKPKGTTPRKSGSRSRGGRAAGVARVDGDRIVRKEKEKGGRSKKGRKAAKKAAKKRSRKTKRDERVFTAKGADRHELYQLSVQSPKEDVRFLTRVYKRLRGEAPLHFREDFCGTGFLSAEWIRRGKQYTAEGFDIDAKTVAWGKEHNFGPLGEKAQRMTFHVEDVREPSEKKPDVRCAQNFSYFVFKERGELLSYLRSAHEDMAPGGIFVMDIYGGPESMTEMEEEREIDEGFTYVWDQDAYHPATGEYLSYIHFRFEDGTELKRAFKYDWRLWSLMELKDALHEVGFSQVDTYWEGTDEDGESGNGVYRKSKRGENCESWVTYLVAYD